MEGEMSVMQEQLEGAGPAVAAGDPSGGPTALGRAGTLFKRLSGARMSGLVGAIAITFIVFDTQNKLFLSSTNLLELVRSMTTLAILAFGETFVLVSGEIGLSLGAIYGLGV